MIVAVDGPSGTGKSTVSRAVARRRGLPHLDTGAFYRAATLAVLRSGVSPGDAQAASAVVAAAEMDQIEGRMYLDAEDVTEEIRSPEVTQTVSQVSAHPAVRELLVDHQRRWVERHGGRAVVEGRDIGSVVFPDATVKIYLDARPEVRAQRRALETGENPEEVLGDIRRRDEYDSTRSASPLTVPEGAVIVDTSDLSFDEVVESVLALLPADS
ncbi:MAG TPA: (d)CMP kinase [Acidimicrobiia bacterium]|nr:(d)CMP kinase [Acidimicrobiia bacterium]